MNDQITQIFKKIFPTTHKSIAKLLENLTPIFQKTFKPKWRRGKKHVSLRKALAAIFYKIKAGCPWRQLPEFFGNWRTIYGWYRKMARSYFCGIFYQKLIVALQEENPKLAERLIFDGSLVLAKNGGLYAKRNPRAQNKSVINVMFMSNGKGLALNLLIAPGTANDSKLLQPLFNASGDIFEITAPSTAHADKGFDSKDNRVFLLNNNCIPRIPYREYKSRMYPKRRRDRIRGRIERYFARLKQFRALLVTFNRTAESLMADIHVAMLAILSERISARCLGLCFESI